MPVTWSRPKPIDEPNALLAEVMNRHAPDLAEAGVRVLVMLARHTEPDTPALKRGGTPVAALPQVRNLHDRVAHGFDAEVKLDGREWDEFTRGRKAAVLMHVLKRFELVQRELDGGRLVVDKDDAGRPKLKVRPPDWATGDGLACVVGEYGEDALEYEHARRAHELAEAALNESLAGT